MSLLSRPLPRLEVSIPCAIVSRSFATQHFSRRPSEPASESGSHMGVGSDYPALAEFFFFSSPPRLFLASHNVASLSARRSRLLRVEAAELTALEEIEQRSVRETVGGTVTWVSTRGGSPLKTLRFGFRVLSSGKH